MKSQPLREKFDSPRAGTLKCVQTYACTWYTHAYIFKKKFLILGKSDPVGRPETRNFLVRPNEKYVDPLQRQTRKIKQTEERGGGGGGEFFLIPLHQAVSCTCAQPRSTCSEGRVEPRSFDYFSFLSAFRTCRHTHCSLIVCVSWSTLKQLARVCVSWSTLKQLARCSCANSFRNIRIQNASRGNCW